MEIKIKRTYKGITKSTYNVQYKKNNSFKPRTWILRFKKESYGWGLFEIENHSPTADRGWGDGSYTNITTEAIPREVIIKMENILRGLNGRDGLV